MPACAYSCARICGYAMMWIMTPKYKFKFLCVCIYIYIYIYIYHKRDQIVVHKILHSKKNIDFHKTC